MCPVMIPFSTLDDTDASPLGPKLYGIDQEIRKYLDEAILLLSIKKATSAGTDQSHHTAPPQPQKCGTGRAYGEQVADRHSLGSFVLCPSQSILSCLLQPLVCISPKLFPSCVL